MANANDPGPIQIGKCDIIRNMWPFQLPVSDSHQLHINDYVNVIICHYLIKFPTLPVTIGNHPYARGSLATYNREDWELMMWPQLTQHAPRRVFGSPGSTKAPSTAHAAAAWPPHSEAQGLGLVATKHGLFRLVLSDRFYWAIKMERCVLTCFIGQ